MVRFPEQLRCSWRDQACTADQAGELSRRLLLVNVSKSRGPGEGGAVKGRLIFSMRKANVSGKATLVRMNITSKGERRG